ncbi:MAG: CDP-alcohol phosphatidyltransferase family protein [Patescibacteria group bacterium]
MKYFRLLRIADGISMISLVFAFNSISKIYEGSAKWSILYFLIAFLFDLLDGYVSRRFQMGGELGRIIDSIVDFFTYCIFSAYFIVRFINPNQFIGYVCASFIVVLGAIRLSRFVKVGVLKDSSGLYYRGITVVHVALLIVLSYLIPMFRSGIPAILVQLAIILFSVGMLSQYKSRKVSSGILAFGIIIIFVTVLVTF